MLFSENIPNIEDSQIQQKLEKDFPSNLFLTLFLQKYLERERSETVARTRACGLLVVRVSNWELTGGL